MLLLWIPDGGTLIDIVTVSRHLQGVCIYWAPHPSVSNFNLTAA